VLPYRAVFIDDISKNRIPAILIKINIDIGHRYSVEIKEPFEEKAILYRVDVGDSEQKATADPAAEPLPGPTDTFISRAALRKS